MFESTILTSKAEILWLLMQLTTATTKSTGGLFLFTNTRFVYKKIAISDASSLRHALSTAEWGTCLSSDSRGHTDIRNTSHSVYSATNHGLPKRWRGITRYQLLTIHYYQIRVCETRMRPQNNVPRKRVSVILFQRCQRSRCPYSKMVPSKHETLIQCWTDVGPAS